MKKYMFGLLAIAIAATTVSFTVVSKKAIVQKHFITGKALNQARLASAYDDAISGSDCDAGAVKPCVIQYDNTVFASLQAYLNSFSTDQAVVNAAVQTRTN